MVVCGVSFTVAPGEAVLVSGPNGAGKSTLLRALAGIAEPSAGRLERPPGRCAYTPEQPALGASVTVARWLGGMQRVHAPGPADPAALLADAGLDAGLGRRALNTLSKGQLQRVALAGALSGRPRVLVLDEPFAGLDDPARGWLARTLADRVGRGALAVLTDHTGAVETLLPGACRLHLGAPAREDRGDPCAPVTITAIDGRGRAHELRTTRRERDARLRELLDDGWGIERVSPS